MGVRNKLNVLNRDSTFERVVCYRIVMKSRVRRNGPSGKGAGHAYPCSSHAMCRPGKCK